MKWEPPHGFCLEGPCPWAWHRTEAHLKVVPISIRFERFTVFHTSALPEVMVEENEKAGPHSVQTGFF
jgi:hypothetical protein